MDKYVTLPTPEGSPPASARSGCAQSFDWSFEAAPKEPGPPPNVEQEPSLLPSALDLLPHQFADSAVELAYQMHFDRMKVHDTSRHLP